MTQNEFIPAFMLLTINEKEEATDVTLLAPERDFQDINEAVGIILENFEK